MTERTLQAEAFVERGLDEVFEFFADAKNLEVLTPPMLNFRILTPPPIVMRVGTLIDYKLRVRGVPMRWQSEITVWDPPHRFVDEQRRGPYRLWHHEHSFEAADGGTWVRDHVRYEAPGWFLEPLIHRLLVKRDVKKIFEYREAKLRALFA